MLTTALVMLPECFREHFENIYLLIRPRTFGKHIVLVCEVRSYETNSQKYSPLTRCQKAHVSCIMLQMVEQTNNLFIIIHNNFNFTQRPDGAVSSENSHSHFVTTTHCAATREGTDGAAVYRPFSRRHVTSLEIPIEQARVQWFLLGVYVHLYNSDTHF